MLVPMIECRFYSGREGRRDKARHHLPLGFVVADRPVQQGQHHPDNPLCGGGVVVGQTVELGRELRHDRRFGDPGPLLGAANRTEDQLAERIRPNLAEPTLIAVTIRSAPVRPSTARLTDSTMREAARTMTASRISRLP